MPFCQQGCRVYGESSRALLLMWEDLIDVWVWNDGRILNQMKLYTFHIPKISHRPAPPAPLKVLKKIKRRRAHHSGQYHSIPPPSNYPLFNIPAGSHFSPFSPFTLAGKLLKFHLLEGVESWRKSGFVPRTIPTYSPARRWATGGFANTIHNWRLIFQTIKNNWLLLWNPPLRLVRPPQFLTPREAEDFHKNDFSHLGKSISIGAIANTEWKLH